MRKVNLAFLTAIIAIVASFTAMAGTWKSDSNGWWYDEGNGSFPKNTWSWIDGNNDGVSECYYFDGNGYCLINTITPDYYFVNPSGAWVVNGVVQTKNSGDSVGTKVAESVDVVTGKITIGESKKKKNKNSSKNEEDDYDYEEYEDDSENEENDSSSSSTNSSSGKSSSEKSGSNRFRNNLNMFSLTKEASRCVGAISSHVNLRGKDWNGATYFDPLGSNEYAYVEYYIGGNYNKLTISATPKTDSGFRAGEVANVTVYDAETEDVLYSTTVTDDTKLFTITADVTDVNYIRIECRHEGMGNGVEVMMKDAILTK